VQATLCALTADSIAESILTLDVSADEAFVCGGGAHNRALMSRLKQQLKDVSLSTTAVLGLDPDWVEAVAFAWLAMRRIHHLPGNMPSVTGAERYAVLGGLYSA
jgi:anhydro-N-acetylmuramic acid kinase